MTSLDENCFYGCDDIKEIHIPETVEIIPITCFEECKALTIITIPLNETKIVCGNKIFNNQPHFNQSIYLPTRIEVINGKEVKPRIETIIIN